MHALEQLPPAPTQSVAPRAAQRISHGTSSGPPQKTTQAARKPAYPKPKAQAHAMSPQIPRHNPQLPLSEETACTGVIAAPENTTRGMLLVAPPGIVTSSLSPCASRVAFKATLLPTTSYNCCFWPAFPRERATSVPSAPV